MFTPEFPVDLELLSELPTIAMLPVVVVIFVEKLGKVTPMRTPSAPGIVLSPVPCIVILPAPVLMVESTMRMPCENTRMFPQGGRMCKSRYVKD